MNRLAVRLGLAMASVVAIAIVLVVSAQFALLRQQFETLPPAVREEVDAIVREPGPPGATDLDRIEQVFLAWLDDPAAREAVVRTLLDTRRPGSQLGFVLAAVLATALAVAVGVVVAGRIARPISAVARAAEQVTRGDLSARASPPGAVVDRRFRRPPGRAPYEVEVLARDFDAMAATLERLELERVRLIADVAHELRTPLAVLQGRLEAMLDGVLPTDADELARLHRQTGHLTRLVEDLRVLSLADADRLELQWADLDLVSWAQDVVTGFGAIATERGVELDVVPEADAIVVPADRRRLTQVLSNLLDNALGVTPAGGRVEVGLGFTGAGARIVVRDDGPGLPAEAPQRLFERFYRSGVTPSERSGGSGLGLAIVRSLVEAHGGRVTAANRAQGGARIEVSLPATPPARKNGSRT